MSMSQETKTTVRKTGSTLDLRGLVGSSEDNARQRLDTEGPNELPTEKQRGVLAIALEVVREPMFVMLVAAGGIYLLMGSPPTRSCCLGSSSWS